MTTPAYQGRHAGKPTSEPAAPGLRRWWNRLTKTILGAGALASAIGAVLALFVAHATANSARFVSVQLMSNAPLSEYQQRSTAFITGPTSGASRPRLAATIAGSPPATAPAISTPPVTPAGSSPPAGSPSPAVTGGTTPSSPPPSGSPTISPSSSALVGAGRFRIVLPPGWSTNYACAVDAAVREIDPGVLPSCTGQPEPYVMDLVHSSALSGDGSPLPVSQAAARIAGVLGQTRTSGNQPLGELVNVNVQLSGLKGQTVFLSWSIYQNGGTNELFGKWLHDFVAYRLLASTEDDTGSVQLWVPLPRSPGPFFLRLTLAADGAQLASDDTSSFS